MTAIASLPDFDIAIVGAGLSGTIAAAVLGRAGYRVALVDRHEVFPPEFRVEKIGGDQIEKLQRLGLLDAVATASIAFDQIVNIRHGRVLDLTHARHYGIFYDDLVRTMREQVPANVQMIFGRVSDIVTGADDQTIEVGGHGSITARLAILATGLGDVLRGRLGIERHVIHERQSLTFGFNVRRSGKNLEGPAVTYYGERPSDGIDYLNLFPAGGLTRANLFTFRSHTDPWVKAFRQSPTETLSATLPGFARSFGDFEIVNGVQTWLQDLSVARNVEQHGVVLIGDAYQTSCPAAGTGVSRLLTDVETLCGVHIPAWFGSPGMDARKIARFYADPDKQAMDAHALALAHYRRSLTIDTSLGWRAHRQMAYARRRVLGALDRVSPGLVSRLRSLRARAA
ncbi:MAG: NAD(P)/FAD-dependent oxidoreductase [Devosia sp.]|nr:NAD(P)/FAD-dependent oxidoreductase [Devosia sp.]